MESESIPSISLVQWKRLEGGGDALIAGGDHIDMGTQNDICMSMNVYDDLLLRRTSRLFPSLLHARTSPPATAHVAWPESVARCQSSRGPRRRP